MKLIKFFSTTLQSISNLTDKKHVDFNKICHGVSTKKSSDISDWYSQIVRKGQLAEYYDISGFYILKPKSIFIWNKIKEYLNDKFKSLNVEEYYFPMFVRKNVMAVEQEHLKGFAPELAWITKYGDTILDEQIAVRPTSEAIIYNYFTESLKSRSQLPLRINQWCNVVRWETKSSLPFIRSREILWQEGHTVHFDKMNAEKEAIDILNIYKHCYTDLLGVPVVAGIKPKGDTFAGADYTLTLEALIPESGKSIQACTSHHLGQNFSKMFDIKVKDSSGNDHYPFQNSWGLSMRSIGVSVMCHGDNHGLIIPPPVAQHQTVIVPCGVSQSREPEAYQNVVTRCNEINESLQLLGIRSFVDLDRDKTTGFKFNMHEFQGVPLRIEIGPHEISKNTILAVKRTDKSKERKIISMIEEIPILLEQIHRDLFVAATEQMNNSIQIAKTLDDAIETIKQKKFPLIGWCGSVGCENTIAQKIGSGKILCVPLENDFPLAECFGCFKRECKMAYYGNCY